MNQRNESFLRRAHKDERGQVLIVVLPMAVLLLGFAAFVVDFGRIYVSFHQLQASTDAAALAGAAALPNGTTAAVQNATLYSGVQGNKNATFLPGVTMVSGYPLTKCLTTLTNQGIACISGANAIQVKQQVTVPLTFAGLVGTSSIYLKASATAAMRGAAYSPYNVAMIIDSTASMNSSDNGSNCSTTKEQCALAGVRTMLGNLSPCGASLSDCGAAVNGQVANPVDQVSLFTFPAVTSASAANDYTCGAGSPATTQYPTASPYTIGGTATYQIVNFSSDFRTSDTATSLNTASNIVIAAGGKPNCPGNPPGLQAAGGRGTYYPGAIYAAQSLLVTQQAANPNTQNVLIILGDGDANASSSNIQGPLNDTGPNMGNYPSSKQQCQQAVTAAQFAASQGTKVYSVAYGATTSGCSSDHGHNALTACTTMQQMASPSTNFFTDSTSGNNGCTSSRSTSTLNQIFAVIAGDLTVARLVPDNLP